MFSLRKWLYKPKRTDLSLLAQFYYADESLCNIATELDSFDGRREPERCARLVSQLRQCQDSVLQYIQHIMDEAIPRQRASRDFRVKYPDDLIQEGLSGQLWFGAECLAAGSSILNREVESASMRPLARSLTKHLDVLRASLRDLCLSAAASSGHQAYSEKMKEGLAAFDQLFADFELSYVSAMVPVKTMKDYETSQDVAVMFSEAVARALQFGLVTQDTLDDCDPALMFTIPRLAIVCGLVVSPDGPLNPDVGAANMSEMFRPFQTLLKKIRELLWTLTPGELYSLERALCSLEDPCPLPRTANTTQDDEACQQRPTPSNDSACRRCQCRSRSRVVCCDDEPTENGDDAERRAEDCGDAAHKCRLVRSVSIQTDQPPGSGSGSQGRRSRRRHHCTSAATVQFAFHLPDKNDSRRIVVERAISFEGASGAASVAKATAKGDDGERPGCGCSCGSCACSSGVGSSCSSLELESDGDECASSNVLRSGEGESSELLYYDANGEAHSYEVAASQRAKPRDISDLVHRLFVCISGVADQLQTNFASDLRGILKYVFDVHASRSCGEGPSRCSVVVTSGLPSLSTSGDGGRESAGTRRPANSSQPGAAVAMMPPAWVPDELHPQCSACKVPFTFVRRRHHCRNCGLIFCSRCSYTWVPLPNYGYDKPVRVCTRCYLYHVDPFAMDPSSSLATSSSSNTSIDT